MAERLLDVVGIGNAIVDVLANADEDLLVKQGMIKGAMTLVDDIERLRLHLGVERWLVAGGSWGSCLALAYGEAHPERCLGFRLRGVILGRVSDIAWW